MKKEAAIRTRPGFSLIELLVVIAVIAILATVTFTLFNRVRGTADRVGSASAMRGMGQAMQQYVNDHDGMLPGPLRNTQNALYSVRSTNYLGYMLATYLDCPAPSEIAQECQPFLTPAFVRERRDDRTPQYLIQTYILAEGIDSRMPFGYPNNPVSGSPWRLDTLLASCNAPDYYALQELDAKHPRVQSWGTTSMVQEPVLGNVRMTLFFDWHVEAVPAVE